MRKLAELEYKALKLDDEEKFKGLTGIEKKKKILEEM